MSVSLITGANRGIGLELVTRLAQSVPGSGMVFACSRGMSKELEELAKQPNVHHVKLDITSQSSVDSAFGIVSNLIGERGINLLVNNAGLLLPSDKPTNVSMEDITRNFDVNVVGTHRVTMKFAPLLFLAAEQNSDQKIGYNRSLCLNLSSAIGSIAITTTCSHSAYRISKAGLNMLTRCTSIEFLEKGVLCCSVHPGWVATAMGGPNAMISTSSCVDDLMDVITKATEEHSGAMVRGKDKEVVVMPF